MSKTDGFEHGRGNRRHMKTWIRGVTRGLVTAALALGVLTGNAFASSGHETLDTVAAAGSWEQDGRSSWCHRSGTGQLDTGWFQDVDGGWYQLGENGVMLAGQWFQDADGSWYYLNVDGRMLAGQWFQDGNGSWYYLGASGAMMKNCVTADGYTLLESGAWDGAEKRKVYGGSSGSSGNGSSGNHGSGSPGNGSIGGSSSSGGGSEKDDGGIVGGGSEESSGSPGGSIHDPGTDRGSHSADDGGVALPEKPPSTVPEESDMQEKNRLRTWLETAKKAEAEITGEEPDAIPDERFLVNNMRENDARLLTIADQIPALDELFVYIIGKNMIPNGMILEHQYCDEVEYAYGVEEQIELGEDVFYVTRFAIRKAADTEESGQDPSCGEDAEDASDPGMEKRHWNIGDVLTGEIDGQRYRFRCIDQDYADGMETHRRTALFLCDEVIPADFGSSYRLEPDENGRYEYHFLPGSIANFGESSDYKYSAVRAWLTDSEENFACAEPVHIGVSQAYTGSTGEDRYSQFRGSELTGHDIGSQYLSGKLFILSVDEAVCYREYLWKFHGSKQENPESQIDEFCKGYWLRTPEGDGDNHDTGKVYIVDLVNGNLHPCEVHPTEKTEEEELNVTGTTGVRPVFTMPQDKVT